MRRRFLYKQFPKAVKNNYPTYAILYVRTDKYKGLGIEPPAYLKSEYIYFSKKPSFGDTTILPERFKGSLVWLHPTKEGRGVVLVKVTDVDIENGTFTYTQNAEAGSIETESIAQIGGIITVICSQDLLGSYSMTI